MINEIKFKISTSKRPSKFQYKVVSENCFKFEPLFVQIKLKNFVVTSTGMYSLRLKATTIRITRTFGSLHNTIPHTTLRLHSRMRRLEIG